MPKQARYLPQEPLFKAQYFSTKHYRKQYKDKSTCKRVTYRLSTSVSLAALVTAGTSKAQFALLTDR